MSENPNHCRVSLHLNTSKMAWFVAMEPGESGNFSNYKPRDSRDLHSSKQPKEQPASKKLKK